MGFHLQHESVQGLLGLAAPPLPQQVTVTPWGCRVGTGAGAPAWHRLWVSLTLAGLPAVAGGSAFGIPFASHLGSLASHLGCHSGIRPLLGLAQQCQLWVTASKCPGSPGSASCLAHTICTWGCGARQARPPCAHLAVPAAPRAGQSCAHSESGGNSVICSAGRRSGVQAWLRNSQELLEWQMQRNSWME